MDSALSVFLCCGDTAGKNVQSGQESTMEIPKISVNDEVAKGRSTGTHANRREAYLHEYWSEIRHFHPVDLIFMGGNSSK